MNDRTDPGGGTPCRWPIFVATICLGATLGSAGAPPDAADIRGLAASGFYTESVARARRVLADAESRAPRSADEAEALDLNLEVLAGSGLEFSEEARALVERALQLKEQLWGREHPQFARTLVLAARLRYIDSPADARDLLERAQSIQEHSLADDDPVLAETRQAFFHLEQHCGNDDRARQFLQKMLDAPQLMADLHDPPTALRRLLFAAFADPERCEERLTELGQEIRREFGPDHPLTGTAILNLATCRGEHGEGDQKRAGMEQALAILRPALGPAHPEVCEVLLGLGEMYGLEDSSRAKSYFSQGLESCAQIAGDSPLVRFALLRYAWFLGVTGESVEAFDMVTRAMSLGPPGFDVRCPSELARLAGYAITMRDRGDLAEAKALLEPIVEQADQVSVGDSASYAEVLHYFGEILYSLGDDDRARSLLERSLAMRERVSGRDYISNWVVLTDLGAVLARLGEWDAADARLQRALELLTRRFGPTHGCISTVLRLVADVQVRRGDLSGARETLTRALAIADAAFGGEGGRTELILRDLCMVEGSIGGLSRDQTTCARALGVTERRYGPHHPGVAHLLGIEAALYQAAGDRQTALALSIDAEQRSRAHFTRTVRALSEREALAFELTRHTGLDVALTVLATGAPNVSGSDVRRVWNEVLRSRAMVLDESIARRRALSGADPETRRLFEKLEAARARLSQAMRRSVDVIDAGKARAELEVAVEGVDAAERKLGARLARGGVRATVGIEDVLSALPPGAALVGYVRYRRLDRSRPSDGTEEYAALIAPSRDGPLEFVNLGEAEPIDRMVAEWSRAVRSEPTPGLGRSAESAYRQAATPLREAIWDPVRRRLGSPSLVLVVPEGPLHLVAFGSLPAEDGRYLVETDAPTQLLSTERDVAALAVEPTHTGGLLAIGSPAFDSAPGVDSFAPLPNAIAEVEEVRRTWLSSRSARSEPGVVLLLGADATEQACKRSAPSSSVIHLATHGFVHPLECTESARCPAAASDRGWLTRAGLAFAGANRRDVVGASETDGILTIEEIASLDLTRTDWVVLSACESGLGAVLDGEGVFGLRRAFQIAGARTTIMSLWQVRDAAARDWMGRLYRARMDGASTVSAVRSATLGTLESRRSQGLDTHPSRWGAFVAVGDWR